MEMAPLLLLAGCLFAPALACGPLVKDPTWYMARLRGALPATNTLNNRFSYTFTRSSFDEAYSVLVPFGSEPLTCQTTRDELFEEGVCLRAADCLLYGGVSHGSCGGVFGTCCLFERQCGQISDAYMTYFTNPRYPEPTIGFGECKLTIAPMNQHICQYRIDFDKLTLAGPDSSSDCVTDTLSITGGSLVPRLCGSLDGQHVYLDTKPGGGPIEISIDTTKGGPQSREWKMRITQVPCDSPKRVPAGCLQFYNGTSGVIRSFNFARELPKNYTTRQLKDHHYGICVNSLVGYCELTWSPTRMPYPFTLGGDPRLREALYGIRNCTSDYITIPGGSFTAASGRSVAVERFCGARFPAKVRTKTNPYMLYVHVDDTEKDDSRNAGFSLDFRHSLC